MQLSAKAHSWIAYSEGTRCESIHKFSHDVFYGLKIAGLFTRWRHRNFFLYVNRKMIE